MSKFCEHRPLERHLVEQLLALDVLKGDSGLKKEIEFESKRRALLNQYGFSMKHIISSLDPQSSKRGTASTATPGPSKARQLKAYKNPHTGEVVETEGGNHKR